MRRLLPRLALLVTLVGLGCGENGDGSSDTPFDGGFHVEAGDFDAGDPAECTAHPLTDPGIVFGSGEVEWMEVADEDSLRFVQGPQGGWHFYGSVKEKGLDVSQPILISFAVFDEGREVHDSGGAYIRPARWVNIGDGYRAAVGYLVIFNIGGPADVDGHTLCVIVRLETADGDAFVDERTISVYFDGKM